MSPEDDVQNDESDTLVKKDKRKSVEDRRKDFRTSKFKS